MPPEHRVEDLVVHRDLLGAGDQAGAGRPLQVVEVVQGRPVDGLAGCDDLGRAERDARRPQPAGGADQSGGGRILAAVRVGRCCRLLMSTTASGASKFKGSPAHVSPVSGPATRAGIRPVMPGLPAEGPGPQPRVSRCLSAAGIRFLGILFPPAGFRSPHGRPTRQCLDPGGVATFRTSESRPDWVPSLPRGPAVLTRPVRSLRPPLAPFFQGPGPITPARIPSSGAVYYEASSRVHSRSPARSSPSPVGPGWDRASWACSPGFAPRQAGPARRTPGQGTDIKHSPGVIRPASAPDLLPLTHSQCATSCRTTGTDMSRFPTPGHLVSWAKFAPKARQSAGRSKAAATGKGNPWLGGTLGEAATSAARTKTFLASRYKRIARRRGKQRALVAVVIHPGHRLAPALRPRRPLHRPRPRLARPPRPAAPQTPAHRRTRTPIRQESHPPRHRLTQPPPNHGPRRTTWTGPWPRSRRAVGWR